MSSVSSIGLLWGKSLSTNRVRKACDVLELEEHTPLASEPGRKVQAHAFEEELIVASRLVAFDCEVVIILEPKRQAAHVQCHGSELQVLEVAPEHVLTVPDGRGLPVLSVRRCREQIHHERQQAGRRPGASLTHTWPTPTVLTYRRQWTTILWRQAGEVSPWA